MRDGDVGDRRGMALTGVSPGGNARSMVKMMTVLTTGDGSDGTVSRPEVRSNSQ